MSIIIQAIVLSFLICYISLPVIIAIADLKKLYDEPSQRKVHSSPIPSLGGVGIFAAVLISVSYCVSFSVNTELQYLFAASIILFFIGLKDDLLVISPFKKFAGQFLAIFIMVYKGNFIIHSFYGFLGVNDLGPILSTVFTFMTMLMIINAFNLIDGVNGLAGLMGLISCTFFGITFFLADQLAYSILSFSVVASLLAFLRFNWTPARIFMGDTGSLFLGLINSILVIKFINLGPINNEFFSISSNALIGFAILFIPLIDTLRVFVVRIMHRKSPFYSDVNHIHHLLLGKGLSHSQVSLSLGLLSITFIVIAFNIQFLGINMAIFILFLLGIILPLLISKGAFRMKKGGKNDKDFEPNSTQISTKTLVSEASKFVETNN
jgi:UDP-N-acetylmuramyl pentapeptide phosphotransferase/UDP-N-acetylglucosamine-1-phosphate transferase